MKAAVLHEVGGPLRVEELELDEPRAGEVLVRLAASGVCHSDLHAITGQIAWPLPAVLGHEGAGVVEAVGPGVEAVAAGDHVVLTWVPYCSECRFCARGRPNLCERQGWSDAGVMMDGTSRLRGQAGPVHHFTSSTFAERAVLAEQCAIPVDPDLPLAELALVGCAVMTGVGAVLNTARVAPGESVAVVGCGGVGLSAVQGAAIAGAEPIVAVDLGPAKLALAQELGATHSVDAAGAREAVADLTDGGADHVVEAVGRPDSIALALDLTGRGGQTVLAGMAAPEARLEVEPLLLTVEERAVRGSWYGSCRPLDDIPRIVGLVREGRLRLDALVSRTCALEEINEAFRAMEAGEVARSVILFEEV